MAYLELDRVAKQFGAQTVVDDFSLAVAKGEFISFLGPSGCGKTTTLQMIAGFLDPTRGAIRLEGNDLNAVHPARRGLGIVFQSYALFPHMTAAENVGFGLEMRNVARTERAERVRAALAMVGLAGYEERHPRRMSGGQQQRVALARALVIRPSVLLLDEPLSNLDAKLREEMQIELRQIQRTLGTTTILVTHDQNEAMSLSDRIVVMSQGRIEQIGTPQETYERPASAFVSQFLGKTNDFAATIDRTSTPARLLAGSWSAPAPAGLSGPVTISIRPERIGFGDTGLCAKIVTRIFQGNHWLFQCESECGPAIVIRQNDGQTQPAEGDAVRLAWRPEDMSARAGAAA
ncbi:ABC transporter ATP-binding protein [Bradyrhizobium viridifuturi]|jgi:putative spermidine/putrescine transport system ATP-binding protein|nr:MULTISPECIES: ABC transporter ATP-binding protein [Bradyrhizobium]ERF84711.1 MAG: spermidine/putrescine transport system ATP-binding protein [Bradyrhizobium sp. DFCI-1]OYU61874.1 MAG: ABC transporter ATP-binding protein [Bradyrhizobium sp. PARBB1]PSO24331.1 ABC transporter ATP-binding protein [Bradyrhizobium sp. MOS004]QRI72135.1 ABC transporter ATP-binding protein [Bradyrhizobium sp. PSBB068]MBR1021844.1 ABC transporter ATP-binding protein [Bradyrhizobium viridifuturi]